MQHLSKLSSLFIGLFIICSCTGVSDSEWTHAVPQKTPFIIIPSENATLNSVFESPFVPLLDDITSSAMQLASEIDSSASASIPLKSILLYPGTDNQLQPVWITQSPDAKGIIKKLKKNYYENFSQNQYYFQDMIIHKLHFKSRNIFTARINELIIFSESSLGVEEAIRAYLDIQAPANLSEIPLTPGSLIMNTPFLDKWAEQLTKVLYRPSLKNAFQGTGAALLQVTEQAGDKNNTYTFSGSVPLTDAPKSELVAAFSKENAPLQLDRYISSNAAAFGIFRLKPGLAPPDSAVPDTTRLDSVLMNDKVLYSNLAKGLGSEFALVTYAESGFLSTGEHLFLRKLENPSELRNQLSSLASMDVIERREGVFFIQSSILAHLIGSRMCTFRDFYLDITGDAAVISKRKGLAEAVASDRSRRRVIYYEQDYMDIRKKFPDQISGMFMANSNFFKFIEPFLGPDNYVNAITSKSDNMVLTTQLDSSSSSLSFNLTTYKTEQSNRPYREKWLFPIGGSELSGNPVLANIGGSSREEIIFATTSGTVYALAADGTVVLQVNTGSDMPLGSPVVYDWYGTSQNVILLAAGQKIYGWNDTGEPLPKFPFNLGEKITSPLVVSDVNRNGLPDAVVATADRKLHALTGRGSNLQGWPLTTNSLIKTKPLVDFFQGAYSVMAFSENAVHAWLPDGTPREDFPVFVNASINGSPFVFEGNILAGGADGNLYSVGKNKLFADSLNTMDNSSEENIQAAYVANTSLIGTPSAQQLTVKTDVNTYKESMILTMSSNGSVFLLNKKGQLRFTQSMGQPASSSFSPFITDINSDNRQDVIALADFGRLYAWQVLNGERIYSLPTTGVGYPVVEDIDGDGYQEVIAQTSEGLRCWTIYGEER